MHGYLRQSTTATILAGPFLAPGDGVTAKTALTAPSGAAAAAATGVALVKNGVAASYTLSGWAHDRLGYYTVNLSAGDTDTVGRLRLEFIDPANYTPVEITYVVLNAAVYDVLFGTVAPATSTDITTILNRLPAIGIAGTVVDTSPTASSFKISNIAAPTFSLVGRTLVFANTSPVLSAYSQISGDTGVGATRTLSFTSPFPQAPSNGDPFYILH